MDSKMQLSKDALKVLAIAGRTCRRSNSCIVTVLHLAHALSSMRSGPYQALPLTAIREEIEPHLRTVSGKSTHVDLSYDSRVLEAIERAGYESINRHGETVELSHLWLGLLSDTEVVAILLGLGLEIQQIQSDLAAALIASESSAGGHCTQSNAVTAADRKAWHNFVFPESKSITCFLCGVAASDTNFLVEGPGVSICGPCIVKCVSQQPASQASGKCAFCGLTKPLCQLSEGGALAHICVDCAQICQEILNTST